jgi:hypothetical protein
MTQVLDNTILDSSYFATYLHYLYFRGDLESIEEWVGVLSFLKVKPTVEYFVNYSLMIKKIKDVQAKDDDSSETKEMIGELGAYFEECPMEDLKESAKYIILMYSKHVAKDKAPAELKEEADKLAESNPEKFKDLVLTHFN